MQFHWQPSKPSESRPSQVGFNWFGSLSYKPRAYESGLLQNFFIISDAHIKTNHNAWLITRRVGEVVRIANSPSSQ